MITTLYEAEASSELANIDGICVVINNTAFDIACVLPDIDIDEINAWQNGIMACAIYPHKTTPLFLLGFNNMAFASGFNFKGLKLPQAAKWLSGGKKYISLLLVEKNGLVIKANHRVSLSQPLARYLKRKLLRQMLMPEIAVKNYSVKLQDQADIEKKFASAKIVWLKR